ncbi:MAG: hypothetical protein QOE79_630 [Sphingomonadales bacterium]|jgi:hypothetical protein|nr:hypothetical protein [Sphingomonadales bacterium]
MTVRSLFLIACLALSAMAAPVRAQPGAAAEFRQIRAGEALQIRPDRAYLLLRFDTSLAKFQADIPRVPDRTEMEAYEAAKRAAYVAAGAKAGPPESFVFYYQGRPNFFALSANKPLVSAGQVATVIAEVTPGDYVLYGEGFGGSLYECFCLGTVGFTAPTGQVTDLGTMIFGRASEPSAFPELAGEVDLGPSAAMDWRLFAVALRPPRTSDALPGGLDPAKVAPARLHAVGQFVEPNTVLINRLAAIPGVLAYDKGRVIDVATGTEAVVN